MLHNCLSFSVVVCCITDVCCITVVCCIIDVCSEGNQLQMLPESFSELVVAGDILLAGNGLTCLTDTFGDLIVQVAVVPGIECQFPCIQW